MKSNKIRTPTFNEEAKTVCIVVSEWHKAITDPLLKGAHKILSENGISPESIVIQRVPGGFELPLGAKWMIQKHSPDAVICLGCIIKGETPHFDFISDSVANGIMQLNLLYNIPVIFGVLTTNTILQAKERSGGKHGNKGEDAAIAALQMIKLCEKTKMEF